ncbi:MAG: hypothetical protein KAI94_14045 [Anaerolineales bacterium]|nr:hypothetical protein [Anaerolineales bacterium]
MVISGLSSTSRMAVEAGSAVSVGDNFVGVDLEVISVVGIIPALAQAA